jgi:hypothetical protein
MVSFYSPAYLVDLLHRIFPRLRSIHLTIVETGRSSDEKCWKIGGCRHPQCVPTECEVLHLFQLSSLTQPSTIDSTIWNDLVTSIRYKLDQDCGRLNPRLRPLLRLRSPLLASDEEDTSLEDPVHTLHVRLLRQLSPISPTLLPNLSQIQFYVRTNQSYLNDKTRDGTAVHLKLELRQLQQLFETICSKELFGVEGVEVDVFRTLVAGNPGQRREVGWETMSRQRIDAILGTLEKGKGKARAMETQDFDPAWTLP